MLHVICTKTKVNHGTKEFCKVHAFSMTGIHKFLFKSEVAIHILTKIRHRPTDLVCFALNSPGQHWFYSNIFITSFHTIVTHIMHLISFLFYFVAKSLANQVNDIPYITIFSAIIFGFRWYFGNLTLIHVFLGTKPSVLSGKKSKIITGDVTVGA